MAARQAGKPGFQCLRNRLARGREGGRGQASPDRRVYRFKIVSMIEEGKSVKAGDPILSFDPSEIMKRMTDERASLDKVKEELEKTHASLDLQGKDLELQLEEAKVQKEKAENKLTEAREFQSNIKVKEAEYEAQLGPQEGRIPSAETRRSEDQQ